MPKVGQTFLVPQTNPLALLFTGLDDVRACGVYAIRNLVNGKVYIGSTVSSFYERWSVHRSEIRRGIHHSKHLQSACGKYGDDAFEFVIVEICDPVRCIAREQHWLDGTQAFKREFGYNTSPTAGSSLGLKRSEETKQKIREFRLTCGLTNKARTGQKQSAEEIAKRVKALTGQRRTPEQLKNLSDAALLNRENRRKAALVRWYGMEVVLEPKQKGEVNVNLLAGTGR